MVKFAWHVHHGVLMEVLTDPIAVRRKYIRDCKPVSEQELRLQLLKPVKGKLPTVLVDAAEALRKARLAIGRRFDYKQDHALTAARKDMSVARRKTVVAVDKLHKQECPDCPWDAQRRSIFPAHYRSW